MELPTWKVYEEVSEILYPDKESTPKEQYDLKMKLRKEVLGESALRSAPGEYWDVGFLIEKGIPLSEWETWDIHHKAKVLAQRYVSNMVEVIDAYYRHQDREREKQGMSHGNALGKGN